MADGERPPITVRFSAETKRQLEQAADRSGWSVSQEIDSRVKQSFVEESMLGSETATAFRTLAGIARIIEQTTGRPWREDYVTAYAVHAAVTQALRALSPSPPDDAVSKYAMADVLDRDGMPAPDPELISKAQGYTEALERAYQLGSALAMGSIATKRHVSKDS